MIGMPGGELLRSAEKSDLTSPRKRIGQVEPRRVNHHWGDFLDRTVKGMWTMSANAQRWRHHYSDLEEAPEDTSILTLTRDDQNWRRATQLKGLRELTLHQPSQEQLAALESFPQISALRISHARPKDLNFLLGQPALRELVLEYVSGFKDISPVGKLPNLVALHCENLRAVRDFSGLAASRSLELLSIQGTLDWNQPVESFDFLGDIESLKYVSVSWCRAPDEDHPFLSVLKLSHLRKFDVGMNTVPLEVHAWLKARLPSVDGVQRPAFFRGDGDKSSPNAYLLGKGERWITGKEETVAAKCRAHAERFERLVATYRESQP